MPAETPWYDAANALLVALADFAATWPAGELGDVLARWAYADEGEQPQPHEAALWQAFDRLAALTAAAEHEAAA